MSTEPEYETTAGGNRTLVNGNEATTLDDCNTLPVQVVGYQADDSHITAQFREQGI
jgi:hypothetical protein